MQSDTKKKFKFFFEGGSSGVRKMFHSQGEVIEGGMRALRYLKEKEHVPIF